MNKKWAIKKQLSIVNWKKNSIILILILICILFFAFLRTHQVSGNSMLPTLNDGDKILVWKGRVPNRFAIITLEPMDNPQESYVKRVIGMPGDKLDLKGNYLRISYVTNKGKEYEEINVTDGVAMILERQDEIPMDKYFVLGDNRSHSNDSRSLGLINRTQIEGVVGWRYYPFNRIGHTK
ncbi:signal peptidase I [Enterococcus ureilyticus]|uniref:signal peptidase I n=1 Tax=Enterococcus ureilyticus TaxID=1131292 RepID=UPI001A91A557|nr:signal peptidase I [Enterococcus ureilyticus]MBO0445119.1 signal peptidase I [Enterococcus ureilyticus]